MPTVTCQNQINEFDRTWLTESQTCAEASEAHQDDLGHWVSVESGQLHGYCGAAWLAKSELALGVGSGAGLKPPNRQLL